MTPHELVPFLRQVVELQFRDGERVRAHILSVDPDVGENHVFYDVLEIIQAGTTSHDMRRRVGFACSAAEITSIVPTDGATYLKAPGSRLGKRPWWRFW